MELSKAQGVGLNDVVFKAMLQPMLAIIGLGLIAGVLLAVGIVEQPLPEGVILLLIATMILPLTFVMYLLVGFFVVPRVLFKPRKKAQLVVHDAKQVFRSYRWRWVGVAMLVSVVCSLVFGALQVLGNLNLGNGISAGTTVAALYAANYSVAKKMLDRGDAALVLVGQAA